MPTKVHFFQFSCSPFLSLCPKVYGRLCFSIFLVLLLSAVTSGTQTAYQQGQQTINTTKEEGINDPIRYYMYQQVRGINDSMSYCMYEQLRERY